MSTFEIKPVKPYFNFVEVFMVPSQTVKTSYLVTLNDAGEWACSCPAWIYSPKRKPCKHIARVLAFRKSYPETVIHPVAPVTRFAAVDA